MAALTGVALPVAAVASWASDAASLAVMRRWSSASLRALGLSLTVQDHNHGVYDDPPYLFVHLNQASLLEIFIYGNVIQKSLRIVMNVEFAMLPVLGPSLLCSGSRVVVRQWPAQAKRVMDRVASDMVERGRSFGLSIEGRRSPDGALSEFKHGAAHLAIRARARVVPFFVHGTYEAMPMGQWRVRPGPLHAVAFEAIDTRGMTLDDRHALTRRLRALAETEVTRRITQPSDRG